MEAVTEAYEIRPKKFRRRKKAEGDDIMDLLAPEKPTLALGKDKGLRCRECGKWKQWKILWTAYERRSGDLMRLWICPDCSGVLRTDNMTGYEAHLEWQEKMNGPNGKRILICGDRNWTDVKAISKVLKGFDPHTTVLICGMARGADIIAYQLAKRMGMHVMEFPAEWKKHERSGPSYARCSCPEGADYCPVAGPRRNRQMLKEGRPELVIAFHDDLYGKTERGRIRGTYDMVKIAKAKGVKVRLARHKVQR